jgi:RNA polymerase sigma factor (sigma-70 family)
VLAGSDQAFRLLVEKYRTDVFRTVYAVLRDQKEAEDAAQEVFIKIYRSLPRYQHQGFKTWIIRIAVNHAIDCKRKMARRKEDTFDQPGLEVFLTEKEFVEQNLFKSERKRLVRERIEDLPENYRDVIYGYYIEEKSYQEMAREQNVKPKSIEVKLYRARNWIKKHWKEEDFS